MPPSVTNLRERMLLKQLDRLSRFREDIPSLQAERAGLSPVEIDLNRQYARLVSEARERTEQALQSVRVQGSLIRSTPESRAPLVPSRQRDGFWRKDQDRIAAILGILQRERRRNASLSREDFSRAQAMAAKSSKADLAKAFRGDPFADTPQSQVKATFSKLQGVDVSWQNVQSDLEDPCVEILRVQRNRREVMAAKGLFRGYRTRKTRRIC